MAESSSLLDAVYRAAVWVGYAGLGGSLAVLLLIWPAGARQRRLALVALAGSALLVLATAGWLVLRLVLGDGPPRVEGTAALVRLAVLAAVGGFFTDLLDRPTLGRRRVAAAIALSALTATTVAGALGAGPGRFGAALSGDVYLALAALVLGACAALVAVVRPGDARSQLPLLQEQTGRLARPVLGVIALAAAVHAVAAERSRAEVPAPLVVVLVLLLVACLVAVGATRRVVGRAQRAADSAPRPPSTVPAAAPAAAPAPAPGRFETVVVDRRPAVGVYAGPRPAPVHEPRVVVVLPDTAAATAAAATAAAAAAATTAAAVATATTAAAVDDDDVHPAGSVRGRRPSVRAQVRARYLAGVGRLPLPDHADPPPVRRTVRVAGATEPLVVELPDTRATPTTR